MKYFKKMFTPPTSALLVGVSRAVVPIVAPESATTETMIKPAMRLTAFKAQRKLSLAVTLSMLATALVASPALATSTNDMIIEVVISDADGDLTLTDLEKHAGVPLEGTVNVTVDWGDGTTAEQFTTAGFKPHLYDTAGTYQITISGTLTHWGFTTMPYQADDGPGDGTTNGENGFADDEMGKITRVIQWGDLGLTNLGYGFAQAVNLVDVPADFPPQVTDAGSLFNENTNLNDPDIVSWNVSSVTDMNEMFMSADAFNQPIGDWYTSSVTDFESMFYFATSFDQPVYFDLTAITNTADVLRLDESGMGPGNTALTVIAWADAAAQPSGLSLKLPSMDRSGIVARDYLETTYGWTFSGSIADIDANIRPSRTNVNGFSGLRAALQGPTIGDVRLGSQSDAFDGFGYVTLIDTGSDPTSNYTFTEESFNVCTPVMDGVAVEELNQEVHGGIFEITCQSVPVAIGGGTLELEMKLVIEGSFIRYTVEVASSSTTRDLELRFGGDLGSDSDALIYVVEGNTQVLATEDEDFVDPVITFDFSKPFTAIRSGETTSTLNDLDGDDELFFDFGSTAIEAEATLVDLEMAFIDYHPEDLSVDQAIEFGRLILASTDDLFGMCLPVVRDGVVPELIDECIAHPDKPTPINFANFNASQEFVDVGEPSVAGQEYLFENAATIAGQQINARVSIDNLAEMRSDELEDLDESGEDSWAEWYEWYLRMDFESSASASVDNEARAELTIQFEDVQGNPYQINELFLNVYDIDEFQFVELPAFQDFYLDPNTILNTREAASGWTRFEELEGASTSTNTSDPRTISRVKVRYENVTEIRYAVGQTNASDFANIYFDFSSGVSWESAENPGALEPEAVANFVDLPVAAASAPYTGPLLTDYSDTAPQIGDEVVVTGLRLNLVTSCTIDGIEVAMSNQSEGSFTILIPSGVEPGLKSLVVYSSAGALTVQDALNVSAATAGSSEIISSLTLKAWTKKMTDSTVKIYTKNIVGGGKIQIHAQWQRDCLGSCGLCSRPQAKNCQWCSLLGPNRGPSRRTEERPRGLPRWGQDQANCLQLLAT